ncbi:polysaccharide biosynthesis protein [Streptacidiphilus jiangxiensis]|uniref:NDP-sugar epimerase, includes UDP-GlcNAc-inverting 4,6-dehydratase FlaA1 and capsular polysaccharide biosynthesis protein EpsC n=1 Tax=Streptacidiphilus jiangxiensis TaxID=235985 RepID=A0A1H7QNX8_STRJI|nr:polysaccharide biosynthesis protein [Streptacidiphilus jiangxiensis]SEL49632.1 NDP-sugar epimerase, includes UDP-GlcNAc-inverting 4,6-dehydratase FlaA1 and capsular polysaccharide biosynthesis protein EpsC [Streptacidiphilus jiangxiensis]
MQLVHRDHRSRRTRPARPTGCRTLIVGAGDAGRTLAHDLLETPSYGLAPFGFLDDDPTKHRVDRLPVLGPLAALAAVVQAEAVDVVIVAIPSLPPLELAALLRQAADSGARVRYLPAFHAAVQRGSRAGDLWQVSPTTLLGRDEIHVVRAATRSVVAGRRVLVTGAGGSIGSELCRQVRSYHPSALYMLDHDESNLHRLQLEVTGRALLDTDELLVADIRDRARLDQIFATLRPEVVFHAAAHKHLPLLELHPCEGVKSNVMGTQHLVEAAVTHGTRRFVLISTDKAASPTSVLGATKQLAELIVRSHAGEGTSVGSVRFGNVLGSRGSFLHVMAHQIANDEPVTITDPEVDRFFMTVEEAVGLVLEAAAMAEAGETFVLDMGEPVRMVSLVENYAALVGKPDVQIRFTGLRPGEKLNETLFAEAEENVPTAHPRISATRGAVLPDNLDTGLKELYEAAGHNDSCAVRRRMAALVPEYRPPLLTEPAARDLLDTLWLDDF